MKEKANSVTVLKWVEQGLRYNESVYAYDGPTLKPLKKEEKGNRPCAHCGDKDTLYVGDDSFGSNAGGIDIEEYKCMQCMNYSVYTREWG